MWILKGFFCAFTENLKKHCIFYLNKMILMMFTATLTAVVCGVIAQAFLKRVLD